MQRFGKSTISRLRYSEDALNDLRAIFGWTKRHYGRDQANAYTAGLEKACDGLLRYPAGAPVHASGARSYCAKRYRSHRIFYRADGGDLLVVRILHTAQDAPAALDD
ncbi:MAG: hypothetical protein AVDCRST_MAG31-1645 [uncultured Sphingomonas sp.]|uniref:Toxin n=1 Tax=uncultured Sphingomonas sp. TaxID=158754 RepID=A0A6J4TGK0_9SPHN|nr:type II toxin-antitoxin system RelE/ParE family toxin [uncultured Sphingomonas sp.]CAA9521549.1 MAG: hypothetical protein AVDCRST_MAG31-1645 [uncultured Sphingomonas sp.]